MNTAVLVAGDHHPVSARELYASFGSARAGGWLLGVECDAVEPGSAVSACIPVGGGGAEVRLLGRICECEPGQSITIAHDQPWRGRIRLRFRDEPGGSSVRVVAELDDAGVSWWMEQRGWSQETSADPSAHRIGLLTSKTGPGVVFAVSCENLAQLATDMVNADGGIRGSRVELVVHDDATDPGRAALEARRMVHQGCRAIVASVTSASFEAVRCAVASTGVPLIHPVVNEGGRGEANIFRWGERPLAQVRAATPRMTRDGGDPNWFHVGNDYSWSHGAHRAAVQAIDERGGSVVGHAFTPLGTKDFAPLIDVIERSGARSVLSSLVGADEVAFERQLWDSGLRARCSVLSLVLDESTREQIGDRVAEGIWTAFGYFSALDSDVNQDLRQRYYRAYGAWAPPISSFSESVYEAILLYANAAATPSRDVADTLRNLCVQAADLPRGHVELDGPRWMRQRMIVARSAGAGYHLSPE